MNNKTKLVYYDIINRGTDWLDIYFNESTSELSEVIVLNEFDGIKIEELPLYDGWDYLIIPLNEHQQSINQILSSLQIPADKVVYFNDFEVICSDWQKQKSIFNNGFSRWVDYHLVMKNYTSKLMGDYASISVGGMHYLNTATDRTIMPNMYAHQRTWSADDMQHFFQLSNKYYHFSNIQDLFFDIGANIGTTCLYFKKKIDTDIKIIAFEPSSENYKLLKINSILNDIAEHDITIINKGVSNTNNDSYMKYNENNPGGSTLLCDDEDGVEPISLTTLDDFISESNIDIGRIKYLWVDIEGSEPDFFQGAKKTLAQINVPIVIEFIPRFHQKSGKFNDFIDCLCHIYTKYILLDDQINKEHAIEELYSYADSKAEMDLFLIK